MHPFTEKEWEQARECYTQCMLLDLKRTHSTLRLIDENFRLLAKLFKHANKLNFQFIKLTYSKAFRPLKDNLSWRTFLGLNTQYYWKVENLSNIHCTVIWTRKKNILKSSWSSNEVYYILKYPLMLNKTSKAVSLLVVTGC